MKLATFNMGGAPTWGLVEGETIKDVGAVLGSRYPTVKSVIVADAFAEAATAATKAKAYPLADITWLPVIPDPDKILCIGLNYESQGNRSFGSGEPNGVHALRQ